MGSRVVVPKTVRLQISQGDWLLVKERLNAGEARAQFKRIVESNEAGKAPKLDSTEVGMSRVLAYLLDWSLTDPKGSPILIRDQPESTVKAALNSIDLESFSEILKAITAHEEAMDAQRAAEKNSQDGETTSSATSPSLNALAGAMSGSLN